MTLYPQVQVIEVPVDALSTRSSHETLYPQAQVIVVPVDALSSGSIY